MYEFVGGFDWLWKVLLGCYGFWVYILCFVSLCGFVGVGLRCFVLFCLLFCSFCVGVCLFWFAGAILLIRVSLL